MHRLELDAAAFASISGKLNSVAALKKHVSQVREEQKDQVKEVSCLGCCAGDCADCSSGPGCLQDHWSPTV
jgi:hypothetical protein